MALEYSLYLQSEISLKEVMQLLRQKLNSEIKVGELKKNHFFLNLENRFSINAILLNPQTVLPSFVENLGFTPKWLLIFRLDKFSDIIHSRKLIIRTSIELAKENDLNLLLVYLGEIVILFRKSDEYVVNFDVYHSDKDFFNNLSVPVKIQKMEIE